MLGQCANRGGCAVTDRVDETDKALAAAAGAAALGLLLPLTPLAGPLRLAALPASYALWLIAVLCTYGLAAHLVKKCYLRFVGWM